MKWGSVHSSLFPCVYKVAELPLLDKIIHHENTIRKVENCDILESLDISASSLEHNVHFYIEDIHVLFILVYMHLYLVYMPIILSDFTVTDLFSTGSFLPYEKILQRIAPCIVIEYMNDNIVKLLHGELV